MASFTAVFIKCSEKQMKTFAERIIDELRGKKDKCIVRFRKGNPWLALHDISSDGPKTASRLSRSHDTESIFLDAQTVVDHHHYAHFVGGDRRRELKYCPESGGWLTAFGKEEPWEREELFARQIESLEDMRQQLAEASDPKERKWLEGEVTALEGNKIVLGHASPFFKISHVGTAFGLPGFGPEALELRPKKPWWTFELQL